MSGMKQNGRNCLSRVKNEQGSVTLVGLILVAVSALMVAALWDIEEQENKRINQGVRTHELQLIAEWAARREYEAIRQNPVRLEKILADHQMGDKLGKGFNGSTVSGIKYAVYTGVRQEQIVIWAVAEQGDAKAQCGYYLTYDRTAGECLLKGMF